MSNVADFPTKTVEIDTAKIDRIAVAELVQQKDETWLVPGTDIKLKIATLNDDVTSKARRVWLLKRRPNVNCFETLIVSDTAAEIRSYLTLINEKDFMSESIWACNPLPITLIGQLIDDYHVETKRLQVLADLVNGK